ncbi:hypothetical protein EON77_11325, partial [bacterium]
MISRTFIDRPVLAWVISILIMLGGVAGIWLLPVEQYPDIAPPSVNIRATYPGASAETLESSVTQIIEQQLTGIDGLIYFSSNSNAAGSSGITVTFDQIVTVGGTPTLLLETGATDRTASYLAGSGTNTLTFRYTVQSGDTSSDLNFASTGALVLNGATISGPFSTAISDPAVLSLPATSNSRSLGSQANIEVHGVGAPVAPVLA